MTEVKNTEELNEAELDQVQGAGTKSLVGDDIGVPGLKPPPKKMESVDDDE